MGSNGSSNNRILVVGDDEMMSKMLRVALATEGFEVIHAQSGEEGYESAMRVSPRAIIADVLLPGMDGFALCRRLRQSPNMRSITILMLTSRGDMGDKIASFQAGADDCMTKPFQAEEIVYRLKGMMARAPVPALASAAPQKRGRVIATFGSKGGVGKTMIATNFAVALRRRSGKQVMLMDADFAFGDANVHLNLPAGSGVLDLVQLVDELTPQTADKVLSVHSSGVRALLCPAHPEDAELITSEHVQKLLSYLTAQSDYLVVDCGANYDDRTLTILERADDILLVVTPEIGPLKNAALFLGLADKLQLDQNKIQVVLNRANSQVGIEEKEVERTLRHKVGFRISSGGRVTVMSVNRGIPLVIGQPDHPVSQQIFFLADAFVKTRQLQTA
jgi:pilus assembly protein CpaE